MIASHAVRKPEPSRLPPELVRSVPRDVRLTSSGIAVVVMAIAIAVGALVVTIVMSGAYTAAEGERGVRARDGVTVDADIVQVARVRGQNTRREVTFRYDVSGRSYMGRVRLRQRGQEIKPGDPIRIGYLASQPATHWLVGEARSGFPLLLIPLTGFSLLLVAAAVAWSVRRQWVLLSEGRAALARVVATKKMRTDKGTSYRVSYEFQTISGSTQTSKCNVGKEPPPIGAVVPVVYHRDTPRWSKIYPLQLVRPGRLVT